jgi:hypothetical protein
MVIRQWTLIFHEFAPGASSFGIVTEEGGLPLSKASEQDLSVLFKLFMLRWL